MKDKLITYLKETQAEMKKVVWPDRKYVMAATTIILILVILTAVFVMLVDFGLTEAFRVLLK